MPEPETLPPDAAPGAAEAPGAVVLGVPGVGGTTPRSRLLRRAERLLLLVAVLCLGTWAYAMLDTRIYQAVEDWRLERELDVRPVPAEGAGAPDAAGHPDLPPLTVTPGEAFGRIEIPRLGVSVVVAEGIGHTTLRRAVGHVPGTALPGEPGNVGLAGHRDGFFRPLKDIVAGDEVVLTTPRGRVRYRVETTKIVSPQEVDVLDPTPEPSLTLVTCYPFYYVGSAPERFIVRAREAPGSAAEPPAG